MPKVSVILTSYNHSDFIRETIESVLNQTFSDFELIIWDDGSKDNSWEIICSYSDPRIKPYRNIVNIGGAIGVNKAISEIASGDYIAIHHSDDVWVLDKLEKQVDFLEANQEVGAVFSNALAIDDSGKPQKDEHHLYATIFAQPNRSRHEWLNHFFCQGNALCHPSVLIRKICYENCGLYKYGLGQLCDFDLWMRLCLQYEIYVFPERLVKFRVHVDELNSSGNRSDVRIRSATESYFLQKNFLQIKSYEELVAIFPEAKIYYREEGFVPEFVLAMAALSDDTLYWSKLFGIELLFELISDKVKAEQIKTLYNFDYHDFIAITGKYDIFFLESVANHNQILIKRENEISSLKNEIVRYEQFGAQRDNEIADLKVHTNYLASEVTRLTEEILTLYSTFSWKITLPLRIIKRKIMGWKG